MDISEGGPDSYRDRLLRVFRVYFPLLNAYLCQVNTRKNIRSLSSDELKQFFLDHGEKAFRAKQAWEWLWMKSACSFDEMSNLSKETRALLTEHFSFPVVTIDNFQVN